MGDYLDDESTVHFDALRRTLDQRQIPYVVNPMIVRGLDYYNSTVFEWTTDSLGAQGTVCAGGRYDGLVEQVGGRSTPGVGFAMGLDRLAMMLDDKFESTAPADVYIASLGEIARTFSLMLAEDIRNTLDTCRIVVHCADGKLKSQMKKADASGARVALIVGEDEVAGGEVTVKHLATGDQQTISVAEITEHLSKLLSKE
jgi:histidyl-tRNA synthetase